MHPLSKGSRLASWTTQDPAEYEYLWRLTQDVPAIEGLGAPVTLVPRRGDVFFMQHLFGHNGTPNTSGSVRLCLRCVVRGCNLGHQLCFANWCPGLASRGAQVLLLVQELPELVAEDRGVGALVPARLRGPGWLDTARLGRQLTAFLFSGQESAWQRCAALAQSL